jgi:hypothetical protein
MTLARKFSSWYDLPPQDELNVSGDPNDHPLASDSVESSYITALCALYGDQRVAFSNPYPHPRGKAPKALHQRLQINWAAETRRNFEDRAINGFKDGYTLTELRSLSGKMLAGEERLVGTEPLVLLRTRLDSLMLHSMMLRGSPVGVQSSQASAPPVSSMKGIRPVLPW